jgi:hypothetical protein
MTHDHSDRPAQPAPRHNDSHARPEPAATRHEEPGHRAADGVHIGQEQLLGPDPSVREVARAARNAWFSRDLLRSGPTLWPFGRRARDRRARNQAAAVEAHRRRAELRAAFDTLFTTTSGTGTGGSVGRPTVSGRARAMVILALTGMVAAVALAAWAWSGPAAGPAPKPTPPSVSPPAATHSTPTKPSATTVVSAATIPAQPPIPPAGVTPTSPHPAVPVDPSSVRVVQPPPGDPTPAELATPEGAMRAWLARWCPFDHGEEFGAAERRARAAMTDAGWSILNPLDGDTGDQRARASWDKTQAAGESGGCSEPTALVSPQAPRSPTSAIVIGAVTRVITAPGQPAYAEPLSVVWRVRQEADGLWRLDLPTEGG